MVAASFPPADQMRRKLTKAALQRIQPLEKDSFLWDSDLPGFGLKVTPRGRRVFVYQFRIRGIQRRVTIGGSPALTIEQARQQVKMLAGRVAGGEDPSSEREERLAAREATVAKLSSAYLSEAETRLKPMSAKEYRRVFAKYITPILGTRPVATVTARDAARLQIGLSDRPIMANRVLATFRAFLFWCERRSYRARGSNPCSDVDRFREAPRERFLVASELARLGSALRDAEQTGLPTAPELVVEPKSPATAKHRPKSLKPVPANPFVVAALRFLVLSGWRKSEALALRWSEVDFERGIATLPTSKTGRTHRPLGAAALAVVSELPKVAGNPYVFAGAKPASNLREIKRTWLAVRHAAALSDVRLHDLRHSFASIAVGSGHSLYLTGALLGHLHPQTTQRYAHLTDDGRKVAADTVSGAISDALAAPTNEGSKVYPIKSQKNRAGLSESRSKRKARGGE